MGNTDRVHWSFQTMVVYGCVVSSGTVYGSSPGTVCCGSDRTAGINGRLYSILVANMVLG